MFNNGFCVRIISCSGQQVVGYNRGGVPWTSISSTNRSIAYNAPC